MRNVWRRRSPPAAAHADHLFVLSMIGSHEVQRRYESLGYPVFEDPTRAVAAVARVASPRSRVRRPLTRAIPLPKTRHSAHRPEHGRRARREAQSKSVLAAAASSSCRRSSRSAGEAAAAAARFCRAGRAQGAVARRAAQVRCRRCRARRRGRRRGADAFLRIASAVARAVPHAAVEGVLVAPMAGEGVEMIVGTARSLVRPVDGRRGRSLRGDIACDRIETGPFGVEAARDMIEGMPGAALLRGVRGPAADIEALAELVSRLSRFAFANARGSRASISILCWCARAEVVRCARRTGRAARSVVELREGDGDERRPGRAGDSHGGRERQSHLHPAEARHRAPRRCTRSHLRAPV